MGGVRLESARLEARKKQLLYIDPLLYFTESTCFPPLSTLSSGIPLPLLNPSNIAISACSVSHPLLLVRHRSSPGCNSTILGHKWMRSEQNSTLIGVGANSADDGNACGSDIVVVVVVVTMVATAVAMTVVVVGMTVVMLVAMTGSSSDDEGADSCSYEPFIITDEYTKQNTEAIII